MKIRILFIEDNVDCSMPIKSILEYEGHIVHVIDNADEAYEEIKNLGIYDMILLDLMLVVGNTFELGDDEPEVGIFLYKKIRENEKYQKTPIIVASAFNKGRFEKYWKNDSFTKYVGKPFSRNIKELREAMKEFGLL